jgi:hypothetical protein
LRRKGDGTGEERKGGRRGTSRRRNRSLVLFFSKEKKKMKIPVPGVLVLVLDLVPSVKRKLKKRKISTPPG